MKIINLVRFTVVAALLGLASSPLAAAEKEAGRDDDAREIKGRPRAAAGATGTAMRADKQDDAGEKEEGDADGTGKAAGFKAGTTLENLMAAYNGESNASAKYAAYAAKAKADGYPSVAALFTAASASEKIHASNHAEVITRRGGKPVADIKTPEPGTTAENLAVAAKGEDFERDVMYPAYMKVARANGERDAVRTFNYAVGAEAGHSKLYKATSEKLVQLKGIDGVVYYVCPTCGYTVTAEEYATFTKCPVCFTNAATFASF